MPVRFVYSDGYDLNLGPHVFPSQKYRLIHEALLYEKIAAPEEIIAPEPATDDQLTLVHDKDWVSRLRRGLLQFHEIMRLEIPYSQPMVQAFILAAGGSIQAARLALTGCVGFNIGGGFHHAFPAHGEGFCALHDIAVAVRVMQHEGKIRRALVIDCDVHHGNGTAAIFTGDDSVFTISLHQFNNYPTEKPPSDIDVDLEDETGDEEYLGKLREAYVPTVERFQPELIAYVAGADPYFDDQLGGLCLTMDGLQRRDELIFETAKARRIPVVVGLAGGYARHVGDTVRIHCNTARAAKKIAC